MTCRHRLGRLTARNRVFRSIFPSTSEPDPARLTPPSDHSPVEVAARRQRTAQSLSDADPMRTYQQESGFCRAIFGACHPSISTLSATTRTRPSAIRRTVIG
jgi:hypothetical protein